MPFIAFYPIGRARKIKAKKLALKITNACGLIIPQKRNIGAKFVNLQGNSQIFTSLFKLYLIFSICFFIFLYMLIFGGWQKKNIHFLQSAASLNLAASLYHHLALSLAYSSICCTINLANHLRSKEGR
jgi:hypothetical protein